MGELNIKKIASIVAYATLILSGFLKFVTVSEIITLNTYEIKGFAIVMVGFALLVYAVSTKTKLFEYMSYMVCAGGYAYTLITVFNTYDDTLKLEIGFYFYVISAGILLISLFMPTESNHKHEATEEEKKIINNINGQRNNYIIGSYVYGLSDREEFSNHRCALATIPTLSNLMFVLATDRIINIELKYDQIEKIKVKKSLSYRKDLNDPEKVANEDNMLKQTLSTSLGMRIIEDAPNVDANGLPNTPEEYIAELHCKINNVPKKIVVIFDKNPDYFFQVFDTLYEKEVPGTQIGE